MKFRVLLVFSILALALSACVSLAEDITPPPNYVSPTPAPTMGALFPSSPLDLSEGASIFAEKCSPCHGSQGLGDGPQSKQLQVNVPALGVAEIARRSSPSEWYTVVTRGRIQNFMPPFSSLTDQQRWNVVAYAFSLSTTSDDLAKGKTLYEANCAQCHGVNGNTIPGADLSSQEVMSGLSQNDLYSFIIKGVQPGMPGFEGQLSEADAFAVSAYVRGFTLLAQPAAPAATATPLPATPTPLPAATEGTPSAEITPAGTESTPETSATTEGTPATPAATVEGTPAAPAVTGTVTAGAGTVTGKVEYGTGGALPSGLVISLSGYDHGSDPNQTSPAKVVSLTATPAADGTFTFSNVEFAQNRYFVAETEYQGITYKSDGAVGDPAKGLSLTLSPFKVFEVSEDYKQLTLEQLHVFFGVPTGGQIQVYVLYAFTNPTNKSIGVPASDSKLIPFIPLPAGIDPASVGYEDAGMGGAFLPYKENGFAMPPGQAQYGIAAYFNIPFVDSASLELPVALGVKSGNLLVPDGMEMQGDGFVKGDLRPLQNGENYQTYSFSDIPAGGSLKITVSGQPKQTSTSNTPAANGSPNQNIIIGLAALGLVLILGGLFMFWSSRKHSDEGDDDDDEEPADDDAATEELMDAIIALDDQYKSGNISEDAYQVSRAELKAKLKGKL